MRCIGESGKGPIIDKVFALHEAEKALKHYEQRNRFGKIVLQIEGS